MASITHLQDSDPRNDRVERPAIAFALGLAVARVVGGLVEVLVPGLFLRLIGHRGAPPSGTTLGFRMKGGRDLAIGLATIGAAAMGDRDTVAQMTAMGVVIDSVDGAAIARDEGRSMRGPINWVGAYGGYAVGALAALSAWVLGRPAD